MAAIDDLSTLLANLPNYSLISTQMKNDALLGARIPDEDGVWPGQEDYVATYDVYFAALTLLGFLRAQPVVRQSSSEGTSVAVDAPNWSYLASYYASLSTIAQATSNGVLSKVLIPEGPHVRRVRMNDDAGRSRGYDNVDTDLG